MLKQFHILIAGSDTNHIQSLKKALSELNVGLLTQATSGREAIEKWKATNRPVDCLIGEYKMPEGNGLQLLQAIRTGLVRGARPDTCFLFVANDGDPKLVSICARLDVSGFLIKPIARERLVTAITKGRTRAIRINYAAYQSVEIPGT